MHGKSERRPSRNAGWWLLALLPLLACGRSLMYGGKTEITNNPRVDPARFKVVAVIAGDDATPTLNMSAGIRTMLTDSGVVAVKAPGRWETETEATMDICGRLNFNGVVVVVYDRITLRTCPEREIAFEVQGGEEGLRGLGHQLLQYLRPAIDSARVQSRAASDG